MAARREGFVVKIRLGSTGTAVGVGFVVSEKHIVTCAHVVNVALGRPKAEPGRPAETDRVQVEFVLLGDAEGAPLRNCRVAAWDPPPGGHGPGRDVAGLVLVGGDTLPVGAGPARLVDPRAGLADGRTAAVFGYPGTPPRGTNGAWSSCVLRGAVGGGLVQLDTASESALRTQPGYSGAPVIVADRFGDAVAGMLAVASRGGENADAYAVPLPEVAAAWPQVLERSVLPPCPYRGLRAFTAADARDGVFVGREREVERLRDMIRSQPFVVVTGPSGVGKSSLVAAGLEPALAADGWAVASFRPGTAPYDALARALLELEHPGAGHSLEQLEGRARALREEGFWPVATRLAVLTGRSLALVGDQFEEVLSGADPGRTARFLERLLPPPDAPEDSPVRLVCTLRADFLPDLLELPAVGPRLQDRQLNVSPLDETALTRVIVEPAELAGVAYSPGVAEAIAAEAAKAAGSLPLLEFALTELWPMQQDRRITFDAYHALGGVSGALNRHAEDAYRALAQQLEEARIRRVLLAMVRARGGASSAVRVTARREHLGRDWHIAQQLAEPDRRLAVLGSTGPDTAEIAHEALIREWRRLAEWVDEDAEFQQWLAVVEERAADGDLLSATRVQEAGRWLGERSADVPELMKEFVDRSAAAIVMQQRTEVELTKYQEVAAQLQQRSAMLEELNELLTVSIQQKSQFLATMSHELHTPLSALITVARDLADDRERTLTPKQAEYAEVILGAGNNLLRLLKDILDLHYAESGQLDIVPGPVPLLQLADQLDAVFQPLCGKKGLEFEIRLRPGLPETLRSDERRLLQILGSLLANAVTFTEHGSVLLDVRPAGTEVPFQVRERLADGPGPVPELVAFRVADTGVGIPDGKLQVVFEAFAHAGRAGDGSPAGPGLGLPVSREIARLMGGEIHAVSQAGRGSEFTLYLPLVADRTEAPVRPVPPFAPYDREPAEHGAAAPADRFAGQRVLVVDDDAIAGFALAAEFERYGLRVAWADGMASALHEAADPATALVLVNVSARGVDGPALVGALAGPARPGPLPVVAFDRRELPGSAERALAAGAADWFPDRSVRPERLLPVIRRRLRQPAAEGGGEGPAVPAGQP
ncbi:ATP-binding protein [Streptomyces sp. NPDC089919]|uniref:nSTAND1 domain-containing NTPase n=1 Tax=Streptomyces sp. NPDC089919 TaxID=3155188 RepID=UPI003415AEA2